MEPKTQTRIRPDGAGIHLWTKAHENERKKRRGPKEQTKNLPKMKEL